MDKQTSPDSETVRRHLETVDLSRATTIKVAEFFRVSITVLYKSLREDGVTFQALKDAERLRRLAHLGHKTPAKQVARVTGHSHPNHMYRWYRAQTGRSWGDRRLDATGERQ